MRILVLTLTLALFGIASTSAIASEHNHFAKGAKSYQKTKPSGDNTAQEPAEQQTSTTSENPQDISPAAGAEEENENTTSAKEALRESMKLPRK